MPDKTLLAPTEEFYEAIFGELPKRNMDESDLPELIEILGTLRSHEAAVIKKRYGFGCSKETFQKIGEGYGKPKGRMRDIQLKAIAELQHPSRAKRIQLLFMTRAELREQVTDLTMTTIEKLAVEARED